jgi:hypothetical protein
MEITYLEKFITPLTPYFICAHFISTELYRYDSKYIGIQLNLSSNDLFKNKNYNSIKNNDIIQVQVDLFDFFYDVVLPIICKNNIKVIIITSQLHLPQLHINYKTDAVLNNSNILLWISQNPIYKHAKYMSFPYGLRHDNLSEYVEFMLSDTHNHKQTKLTNSPSRVHCHLPDTHIRKRNAIFGNSCINYKDFLSQISTSQFVISTTGDRDDCYRHYECIGLNAVPVSNINVIYKDIFEDDMIYSNETEMVDMINTTNINHKYTPPNKDILTIHYWICKINNKLYELT